MPLILVVVALGLVAVSLGLINLFFPGSGKTATILNWTAAICLCLGLMRAFDWLRDLSLLK